MMEKNTFSIEILPNKFYFSSEEEKVLGNAEVLFFNLDESVKYVPFNEDFGPLNIQKIFAYVDQMH